MSSTPFRLPALPSALRATVGRREWPPSVGETYETGDPLEVLVPSVIGITVLCWTLSVTLRHYSFVDRLWSLLPLYYAGVIAWYAVDEALDVLQTSSTLGGVSGQSTSTETPWVSHLWSLLSLRPVIMFLLILVWSLRLTYNFWRKGGYAWPSEDYRWRYVQREFRRISSPCMRRILWEIFNLVFIALIQNLLLVGLVYPVYVAWQAQHEGLNYVRKLVTPAIQYATAEHLSEPLLATSIENHIYSTTLKAYSQLNLVDVLGMVLWLTWLIGEAVADQQQWQFQQAKVRYGPLRYQPSRNRDTVPTPNDTDCPQVVAQDIQRGFLTRGLFSLSRHPNFFCEMALWWTLGLFAVAAWIAGQQVNLILDHVIARQTGLTLKYRHQSLLDSFYTVPGVSNLESAIVSVLIQVWADSSLLSAFGTILLWTVVSPLGLTVIFQGSTRLTEHISRSKYPLYALYQRTTARFLPWWSATRSPFLSLYARKKVA
ncbi:hypothetical protein IWQ62_000426 [Dispira parvispora]|uniref:Uncharacterized protein n=1 Tax=Dispira parvispora TaxID=1520584 RepID=A0A9W8AUU4_9FUNG|nr:hypothetical protein IWQ62_000426 [Dispira parvispora]